MDLKGFEGVKQDSGDVALFGPFANLRSWFAPRETTGTIAGVPHGVGHQHLCALAFHPPFGPPPST